MAKKVITFDDSARNHVMASFGLTADNDGYLVEKTNRSNRVISINGDPIKADRLASIKKGSLQLFNSDLPSLIQLADRLK